MLYLNQLDVEAVGIAWPKVIQQIEEAVITKQGTDWCQPIKPYLRYGDPKNRIIAMPAYLGGSIGMAGIKWIASFPDNLSNGVKRAHSLTILNEPHTGVPLCIINTALVSGIRTAGVTGLVIQKIIEARPFIKPVYVGLAGFGPIGQLHLQMLNQLLGNQIFKVGIFDTKVPDKHQVPKELKDRVFFVERWEEAYVPADIFITCTVSLKPYVNLSPKKGSLQLNVSLRDYLPIVQEFMDRILVDDWEEVCRENTDIEAMHKTNGLKKEDTYPITSVCSGNLLSKLSETDVVMFNPMGMAVFDIAIAKYYYQQALTQKKGTVLV